MKRIFINLDKCNGCRECELSCAAKQSSQLKLLKRRKDGKLRHPQIKLTRKPIPNSLISINRLAGKGSRFKEEILTRLALFSNPPDRLSSRAGLKPQTSNLYLPLVCLHCEDAPCRDACISGAMKQDEKNGLVYVDRAQCVGCWSCIMVCPFGIINRSRSKDKQLAAKCDGCPDLSEPACVTFCKPEALVWLSPDEFVKSTRRDAIKRKLTPKAFGVILSGAIGATKNL